MRKSLLLALVAVLALGSAACGRIGGAKSKAGYAIGLSIGKSMASIQDKIDLDQVAAGLKDQIAGTPKQTEGETGQILISPLPGLTTTKPGSATFPLPGISASTASGLSGILFNQPAPRSL